MLQRCTAARWRFFQWALLMALAGFAPVRADTNLLSSGMWAIDGGTALPTNAVGIRVASGKRLVGVFSELKFFYNFDGRNLVQVFAITSSGAWQPALPPAADDGGTFQLGSYRDCTQGLVGALAVTDLVLPLQAKRNGILQLTGALANNNSLRGDKLLMTFHPPTPTAVQVDIKCRLVATRDFCVDQTGAAAQDKFRVVTILARSASPTDYDNDLVRYVRTTEKTCFGIYGCYTRHQSYCVNVLDQLPGYLINTPHPLGNPWLLLAHTTTTPRATPSLQLAIRSPSGIRAQGLLEPPMVELWGNWSHVKKSYKARQTVLRLNCSLEAIPPRAIGCDYRQVP